MSEPRRFFYPSLPSPAYHTWVESGRLSVNLANIPFSSHWGSESLLQEVIEFGWHYS